MTHYKDEANQGHRVGRGNASERLKHKWRKDNDVDSIVGLAAYKPPNRSNEATETAVEDRLIRSKRVQFFLDSARADRAAREKKTRDPSVRLQKPLVCSVREQSTILRPRIKWP